MSDRLANRYQVLALLGEGGMGQVYRVADVLDGRRELALKVIKVAGEATADQRLRFKAEFRAMKRLRHPNTIAVHDYGALGDGNLYIAMELVPGRELVELIGGRPMALAEVYPLLIQLLQALDFIHSRSYVHRDIKAANVRVRDDGVLKLMDFGLMGQLGQPSSRQVTGTPGYMAPEVAQGGVLTAASDLYSVGCLAYEMLTGQLPFEGSLIEVVRAHVQAPPVPLRRRRPDVPEGLERLVMRLLAKDPAQRYRSAALVIEDLAALAGVALTRESRDQQASFLTTGEIVGREAELRRLDAALADALVGRGHAIFLSAPAGTGKSRLVQELELKAKLAGMVVMHGGCHDEGMRPYEAIAASLRPTIAHGGAAEQERYGEVLGKLFPDLCPEAAQAPAPDAAELAEAVASWLAELSTRAPVLWLLDDLHWADAATLDVFTYALGRLRDAPVLAVGSFRCDETPAGSRIWQVLEAGDAERLALGPLDATGQRRLLEAMLPDAEIPDAFAQELDRATGGNPFFLTEVVRSLLEDGLLRRDEGRWRFPGDPGVLRPLSSMEATLRRRLGHLSRGARRLIGAAAVLGHEWRVATLMEVCGLDEEGCLTDLEELALRQFLTRTDEGGYRFPHDRVREVTYAELGPAVRKALHLRAGEVLEAAHADDPEAIAHELARHFLHGGDGPRAYRYLMAAGRQADHAGADVVALEHWREAERVLEGLALPDKSVHQLRLWFLLGLNGFVQQPELGRSMLARAIAAYEADPVGVERSLAQAGMHACELYGLSAVANGFCGRPREAAAAARLAHELMPVDQAPGAAAAMRFVEVGGLLIGGRIDEMVAISSEVAARLEGLELESLPRVVRGAAIGAFATQNAVAFQGVRPDPSLRERATAAALRNGERGEPFMAGFYFGVWAAWTGRHDQAQAYIDFVAQRSRQVGGPPFPWVLYLRPYMLWQRAEHETALELLERALLAHPTLRENALAFHHALALRGQLLNELRRRDEAQAVFDELVALGRERGAGLTLMLGLLGQGIVALRGDRQAAAREAYDEVHGLARGGPLRNPLFQARAARGLGHVALALGERDEARARFEEALAIAERPEQDNRYMQAHLRRDLGRLALRRGDREAATRELGRAGELFHQLRIPHWLHVVTQDLAGFRQDVVVAKAEASPEARWQLMRGML